MLDLEFYFWGAEGGQTIFTRCGFNFSFGGGGGLFLAMYLHI